MCQSPFQAPIQDYVWVLVQSIEVLHDHSSGIDSDAPIILVGGGAKGKVWQKTISRLSGRELVIPKSTELVAYGAAAQAAGILNNEAAVDVAARWNVSDGQRLAASAVDSEAIERNQCIREAANELNSCKFFNIPQRRT